MPVTDMLFDHQNFSNEADVEQKFVYPLLTSAQYLNAPEEGVRGKEYLAPSGLDKKAGKKSGYYPDFSIWIFGLPVLIAEVKDTSVASERGFREACLYARHLNSKHPSGINPCRFVLATNGQTLLAGYWDQDHPELEIITGDLAVGTRASDSLLKFCQYGVLEEHARQTLAHVRPKLGIKPASLVGNEALLNSKKSVNSFAAPLSPMLRRYFTSASDKNIDEIVEKAYVSSAEITEYDKILESLLKDRGTPNSNTIMQPLNVGRKSEPTLTKALKNYSVSERRSGELQIIQGGVGAGKSLFARRYRKLLQPQDLGLQNIWSFVDFNTSPASLKGAETWLCKAFIESLQEENPAFDLYDLKTLKGIFSKKIQERRAYYQQLRTISTTDEKRAKAEDIVNWQSDLIALSEGIGCYFGGVTKKNLIVVMDNVDRKDLQSQLDAFQLSLWFMNITKCFVILQLRDETYERYKDQPPLDTFRSGISFHISPPRFIDLVKRRIELGLEYLSKNVSSTQTYTTDNNLKIIIPKGDLGDFLIGIYELIFSTRRNISRVLEALAGRDMRRALDMFVSILISGHLSPSAITSAIKGGGEFPISEYHLIRILMRTDYRFFNENSGYISNIFHYENQWVNPDNFIIVEILYFLSLNRKTRGEIGIEGYFTADRVSSHLQKMGYDRHDVLEALNYALTKGLISADHLGRNRVEMNDCVKIQASGYIHLRVLCERIEYVAGVAPATPVSDARVATRIADFVKIENDRGVLHATQSGRAAETFLKFLQDELARRRQRSAFFDPSDSGAFYVTQAMERAVRRLFKLERDDSQTSNPLDFV
jgi:hypothetical protein